MHIDQMHDRVDVSPSVLATATYGPTNVLLHEPLRARRACVGVFYYHVNDAHGYRERCDAETAISARSFIEVALRGVRQPAHSAVPEGASAYLLGAFSSRQSVDDALQNQNGVCGPQTEVASDSHSLMLSLITQFALVRHTVPQARSGLS